MWWLRGLACPVRSLTTKVAAPSWSWGCSPRRSMSLKASAGVGEGDASDFDPSNDVDKIEVAEVVLETVSKQMRVFSCYDEASCDDVLTRCPEFHQSAALGLDIEWKPNTNPTALLQLSTGDTALLFHLAYFKSIPESLGKLLCDPRVLKAGIGTATDAVRIFRDFGIKTLGTVDVTAIARHVGVRRAFGMASSSRIVCNLHISKSKKVSTSNWEEAPLADKQLKYAVQDAWLGLTLLDVLYSRHSHNENIYEFVTRTGGLVGPKGTRLTHSRSGPAGGELPYTPGLFDPPAELSSLDLTISAMEHLPDNNPRPERMHMAFLKYQTENLKLKKLQEKESAMKTLNAEAPTAAKSKAKTVASAAPPKGPSNAEATELLGEDSAESDKAEHIEEPSGDVSLGVGTDAQADKEYALTMPKSRKIWSDEALRATGRDNFQRARHLANLTRHVREGDDQSETAKKAE